VHLLEHGPYRYSRNPLYIALSTVLLGFSFLLNNTWLLLGVPVLLFVLDRTVVTKEEQYLRARFGERYIFYSRKVRRWL
jgi:protein-S-isoprenylcysteine O-methyltransferase Ste14